jgi:hypothetical protein
MGFIDYAMKILGLLPPFGSRISAIYHLHDDSLDFHYSIVPRLLSRLKGDHSTPLAYMLLLTFPSELQMMERIERHILPDQGSEKLLKFKKAFASDCGMFAVAVCMEVIRNNAFAYYNIKRVLS